jgi:hypothetical protein
MIPTGTGCMSLFYKILSERFLWHSYGKTSLCMQQCKTAAPFTTIHVHSNQVPQLSAHMARYHGHNRCIHRRGGSNCDRRIACSPTNSLLASIARAHSRTGQLGTYSHGEHYQLQLGDCHIGLAVSVYQGHHSQPCNLNGHTA